MNKEQPKRTPEHIIGTGLLAQLVAAGYEVVPARDEQAEVVESIDYHAYRVAHIDPPGRTSPPAVAAGGVTIDADLLAKQSTIEPDIAAVVYADRSKLYSDFSGGVTEEQVLAACPAICEGTSFGITWENLLWCISQEQDPIKRMVFEQKRDRVLKIARAALLAALAVGDEGIRGVPKDTVDYVMRYGGRCRDCADENGTCPHSGLPCDTEAASKVIGFVLRAVDYGQRHGYLPTPPSRGEGV